MVQLEPTGVASSGPIRFVMRVERLRAYRNRFRRWCFNAANALPRYPKSSPPLFCLTNDLITEHLHFHGGWEPETQALFELLQADGDAREGASDRRRFSDFLIDIGANIGLTTIASHRRFKTKFCFEPNPATFRVLDANLLTAGVQDCTAFACGLGPTAGVFPLSFAPSNLGGAFVSAGNPYDQGTLANKDGFERFAPERYKTVPVRLESTEFFRSEVVSVLRTLGLRSGIIKLDAEGYERPILQAILPTLAGFEVAVYFESLGSAQVDEIKRLFTDAGFQHIQVAAVYWEHHALTDWRNLRHGLADKLKFSASRLLKPLSEEEGMPSGSDVLVTFK